MTQIITCPSCKQQLQVPEEFLGQAVKCPGCGVAFTVVAGTSTAAAPPAVVPMAPPAAQPPSGAVPTAAPPAVGPGRPVEGSDPARVKSVLLPPAICLLLVSLLGFVCTSFNVIQALAMGDGDRAEIERIAQRFSSPDPKAREAQKQVLDFLLGPGGIALRLVFLFAALVVIGGALAMMNRRMYGLAVAGSILAMFNNFDMCCCVLGFPLGLWALLVLMLPNVKASFQ